MSEPHDAPAETTGGAPPPAGRAPASVTPKKNNFYAWIVDHPVAVWMLTIAVCVFGLVSYAQLPLNLMPDISYPTLTVRTEYAGAAPEEVEAQVSRPLEEALSTVEGLVEIESRSRAGISDVVLEFDWDTAMNGASQDVRERLQTTFLPDGAGRPLILRYDPSLDPILRVAISGGTDLLTLRDYAERELKRDLEAIDGVAAVSVRGGLERLVLVEPREDWLAARGVTLGQLSTLLASENVNVAGGVVREGENEYLIRTLNEFSTLEEVRDLAIVRGDGVRVPVGEVAVVSEGSADPEVVARLGDAVAVEVEVYKEADANIVTVARTVKAAIAGAELPAGFSSKVLDDQAQFIEASLASLFKDGVFGGVLAVLITFVFLRDWTTTGIISTAIPISLMCTFAVMYLGGTSLNLMSLGGLALGVSMVIDSGTVVLESIQNHLDAGKPRRQAAIDGTTEVATAVFASVLTGMAVFFPIVFVEGIAGQIFGDLALTVVFSLAASLVVALVFIPMLASRTLVIAPPPARALDIPTSGPRAALATLREQRRWWAWPWALGRFLIHAGMALSGLVFATLSAWAARFGFATIALTFGVFNRASLAFADAFLAVYGRVEGGFARGLDLVALERDQRRHDHGGAGQDHARELVDRRLARPGRHDGERVAPADHRDVEGLQQPLEIGAALRGHAPSGRRMAREMMWRWISLVPSQMRSTRASRQKRSIGSSLISPMPPKICSVWSVMRANASEAYSLAMAASESVMRPWSHFQAACKVSNSAAASSVAISASLKPVP